MPENGSKYEVEIAAKEQQLFRHLFQNAEVSAAEDLGRGRIRLIATIPEENATEFESRFFRQFAGRKPKRL